MGVEYTPLGIDVGACSHALNPIMNELLLRLLRLDPGF